MNRLIATATATLLLMFGWQQETLAKTIFLKQVHLPDRERLVLTGLAPTARVAMSGDIVDVTCSSEISRVSRVGASSSYIAGVALIRTHVLFLLKPGVSASPAADPRAFAFDLTTRPPDHHPLPAAGVLHSADRSSASNTGQAPLDLRGRSDRGLVPGLPSPFLATVEGQVSKLVATPLAVDPRKPSLRATPPATAETSAPTMSARIDARSAAIARSIDWFVPPNVGVAATRRGGEIIVYFDTDKPIGSAVRTAEPAFGNARIDVGSGMTRVRIPVATATPFRFERVENGWRMTLGEEPAPRDPTSIVRERNRLLFPASSPSASIVARDAVSGATLLVGTVRRDCTDIGPDSATALFAIQATRCGVIVEPRSDQLVLRTTSQGFLLETGDGQDLHAGPEFPARRTEAASFTRILRPDSTATITELGRRLQAQSREAAEAPSRARQRSRLDAAETMLKLGLDREARALVAAAQADNPEADTHGRLGLLQAMTELGTAGAERAGNQVDATGNDEVRLWQALDQSPNCSRSAGPARVIRSELPLLLSYPAPLRSIASGAAASCLLASGTTEDLRVVDRLPDDRTTAVARAVALDRLGNTNAALDRLDKLAGGTDAVESANALLQALLRKGRSGRLSPRAVADLLEAHRLDWRAIGREQDARLAEAVWRVKAHQLRRAFAIWRDVAQHDQARHDAALNAIADALSELGTAGEHVPVPASDYVAIADENAALLSTRPDLARRILPIVAEKLASLSLARQAADTIDKATALLGPGLDRSTLLVRSAELRVDAGQTREAKEVLTSLARDDPSPAVSARAALAKARILQSEGDPAAALTMLDDAGGLASPQLRATLLASNNRWHDARTLLEPLVARMPASGALSPASSDLVLQLATTALRDGQNAEVGALRARFSGRLTDRKAVETLAALAGTVQADHDPPTAPEAAN